MLPAMIKRPVAMPRLAVVLCSAMAALPAVKYMPKAIPSPIMIKVNSADELVKGMANMTSMDRAKAPTIR